jgi:hypothetical protein
MGVKPNVTALRVFGCAAYVYLPPEVRKNKLSAKAELMVFLGYTDGMKGYRFMRMPRNGLFDGATAIFDESRFPKCEQHALAKRPQHTVVGDKTPELSSCDEHASFPEGEFLPSHESPSLEEQGNIPNIPSQPIPTSNPTPSAQGQPHGTGSPSSSGPAPSRQRQQTQSQMPTPSTTTYTPSRTLSPPKKGLTLST